MRKINIYLLLYTILILPHKVAASLAVTLKFRGAVQKKQACNNEEAT